MFGVIAVTNAFPPLLHRSEAGRIVNVSSEIGSLNTMLRDEIPPGMQPGAHGASKSALNMLTVSYGLELEDTSIKINAVAPGFTATGLNGHKGERDVDDAARVAVEAALIGDDGPNAAFMCEGHIDFVDGAAVPWCTPDPSAERGGASPGSRSRARRLSRTGLGRRVAAAARATAPWHENSPAGGAVSGIGGTRTRDQPVMSGEL